MDDDFDDGERREEERSDQVRGALFKALAAVVVIGVVIALGTTIVVRTLGLDESDSPGPVGAAPSKPVQPLPTTALPVPGQETEDAGPTEEPSDQPSDQPSDDGKRGDLQLAISPVTAKPMERVNLTGTYEGADNLQLQVQRFEDGDWSDFGVVANVKVGTFETYVMTGRPGEQRFRVYDAQTRKGSNVVLVTIG